MLNKSESKIATNFIKSLPKEYQSIPGHELQYILMLAGEKIKQKRKDGLNHK
jgi:hypothetical protein